MDGVEATSIACVALLMTKRSIVSEREVGGGASGEGDDQRDGEDYWHQK